MSGNEIVDRQIQRDGVGILTLRREAKRNALSIELRDAIVSTLDAWAEDPSVRVVVLTGAGHTFSAGFDLGEFTDADLAPRIAESSRRYHLAVWSFAKPLIAAVNGPALAGGFDLALLCDLRVASSAAGFGHPEIKLGIPPLFTPLRWIVGDGIARELCLTGRRIDAAEAQRIGLVSRVVPPDELLDTAMDIARDIASAPESTLEATKEYLTRNWDHGFAESFAIEHDDVFARVLSGALGPRAQP